MNRYFETLEDFNTYTENGTRITAGDLYFIKDEKMILKTNNFDGTMQTYDMTEPSGNIELTENGEGIDIAQYASATVAVPQPSGNISITENGTNIDVNDYATASVNVAPNLTTQNITENGTYQPSGNYDGFSSVTVAVPQPSGNIELTENGEGIDIAQYATATVNVAGSGENEDLIDLIERDITTLNIPSGTTTIGVYAFQNCSNLTSITIPSGVTSIGNSAFSGCSCLTSVTIPDTVTNIGSYAFNDCSGLTSVTIGSGVTSIGQSAFYWCRYLTSVTIEATTPPTLGSNAFANTNNCPIYVPAESVEAYKTATNWSSYASRIQAIPTA